MCFNGTDRVQCGLWIFEDLPASYEQDLRKVQNILWRYGLRRTFSILLYRKIATGLGKLTTGTGRRPAAEGARHSISKSLDSRRTLR